jgi:hypothetical protein
MEHVMQDPEGGRVQQIVQSADKTSVIAMDGLPEVNFELEKSEKSVVADEYVEHILALLQHETLPEELTDGQRSLWWVKSV